MISMSIGDATPEGSVTILLTTPRGNLRLIVTSEGLVAHIEDTDGVKINTMWASEEEITGKPH